MKHRRFGKKLGRNIKERQSMFRSQLRSILTNGSMQTTEAKAKAVIPLIENVLNYVVTHDIVLAQRHLNAYLQNKALVSELYQAITTQFKDITSNFTKTHKVGIRRGDDATLVKITFNQAYSFPLKKEEKKEDKKEVKETKKVTKSKKAKL
ncbi:MAG TPA: L17 family ribosomal protein [Candidatus Woesebacteria bacterium]|nr:L17 family ribosomal protein [Candidatus Woesebacteria bacterium]HPJ16852.1 L17 family ribosomal protein [Candidatus Woesebacteria bacterium]